MKYNHSIVKHVHGRILFLYFSPPRHKNNGYPPVRRYPPFTPVSGNARNISAFHSVAKNYRDFYFSYHERKIIFSHKKYTGTKNPYKTFHLLSAACILYLQNSDRIKLFKALSILGIINRILIILDSICFTYIMMNYLFKNSTHILPIGLTSMGIPGSCYHGLNLIFCRLHISFFHCILQNLLYILLQTTFIANIQNSGTALFSLLLILYSEMPA